MKRIHATLLGLTLCLAGGGVAAEPMTLDVVISPIEQIRLDVQDNNGQFVMLMHREGNADGSGVFEGAKVAEYGLHDVTPGDSGNANGYLEATTAGGDTAYFKWQLRAFFVAGSDGNTKVINNGYWELAGGTGRFASMRGVGTMLLEFVSETDRRVILEGDIASKP